jgi:hypothetical protein
MLKNKKQPGKQSSISMAAQGILEAANEAKSYKMIIKRNCESGFS